MQPSDRWIEGIRAGEPRALYALGRFIDRLRRASLELTAREREVLLMMTFGHTRQSAGEQLGISAETVKTHLEMAAIKLNTKTVTHSVAEAYRRGYIE